MQEEAPLLQEGAEALMILQEAPKEAPVNYTPVPVELSGLDPRVWQWLCKLGLPEYGLIFVQHKVEFETLPFLTIDGE